MDICRLISWAYLATVLLLQALCEAAPLDGILSRLTAKRSTDQQCFITIGGRLAVPRDRGLFRKVDLVSPLLNDVDRAKWRCRVHTDDCNKNDNCYSFEYVFPGSRKRWFLMANGKVMMASGPDKAAVIVETLDHRLGYRVLKRPGDSEKVLMGKSMVLTLRPLGMVTDLEAEASIVMA